LEITRGTKLKFITVKATTEFAVELMAWYTQCIADGPYKFHGLPLILSIYDTINIINLMFQV
jgi:GLPGLI family protein